MRARARTRLLGLGFSPAFVALALADPAVADATREDTAVAAAMDWLTMRVPEDMLPQAFSARGKQFEARLHGWAASASDPEAAEELASQLELAGARPQDAQAAALSSRGEMGAALVRVAGAVRQAWASDDAPGAVPRGAIESARQLAREDAERIGEEYDAAEGLASAVAAAQAPDGLIVPLTEEQGEGVSGALGTAEAGSRGGGDDASLAPMACLADGMEQEMEGLRAIYGDAVRVTDSVEQLAHPCAGTVTGAGGARLRALWRHLEVKFPAGEAAIDPSAIQSVAAVGSSSSKPAADKTEGAGRAAARRAERR